jgi:uncharacterized protein
MLIVISPAKTLDYESRVKTRKFSQPEFIKHSKALVKELRELTPEEISELMRVSPKIGELNFSRFINWMSPFTPENARQAIYAFKGDVYTGIEVETYKAADLDFAQKHLRILSGLYGVLRPLDLMQAYRLEMGSRFANAKGSNLYEFWDDQVTRSINSAIAEQQGRVLINLASNEYFKVLKTKELNADIITPVFKDYKNGKYKVVSFFAKKARGLMTSYIIKNRLKKVEDLKSFDISGYGFNEALSDDSEFVFTRKP